MDPQKIRYLIAVSQSGSVRQAAELHRVSAPAISKALSSLESETGCVLTRRVGRGLEVTDQGKRLIEGAAPILRQWEELSASLESCAIVRRPVRIATFEVFSTYFLQIASDSGALESEFELHESLPGELERALGEERVDLGVTYMPSPRQGVEYTKITALEMGVFSKRGAFPGVEQSKLPFVVPVAPLFGASTRVRGLDGWPDDSYPRKVVYQVTLMESALELVRQGRVAGYFPVFIAELYNRKCQPRDRLVRRKSPYGNRVCTTDAYLAKRKGTEETSLERALAKAVRSAGRITWQGDRE